MEGIIILLILGFWGLIFVGAIMGIIAFTRTSKTTKQSVSSNLQNKRMDVIFHRLNEIERKLQGTAQTPPQKPVSYAPAPKPQPAPVPPQPSETPPPPEPVEKLETLIQEISVNEQTQPPAQPKYIRPDKWAKFEAVAGRTWLSWAGIIVFFVSVGLFLKHAFENNWITPSMQIISACGIGVAMFATGLFYARGKYVQFGRSMTGGGLMVLYAALYCAYSPYVYKTPIITESSIAFGLMCVVTVVGIVAAVWLDTQVISALAMLGGFMTPVLISTGIDQRDILFSYLLILDAGILIVSIFRRWRFMDILGFAATILLYVGWYEKFYTPAAQLPALAWLGGFYLIFLALPFMYHMVHKTCVTAERFILSNANAALSFIMAWIILDPDTKTLSWIALGMAIIYAALVLIANRRIPADSLCRIGFVTASLTFATLFVPLQFTGDVISLVWAAMACMSLAIAMRYKYTPMTGISFVVLLLAFGRTIFTAMDMPTPLEGEIIIINKAFITPAFTCVGGFVFALIIKLLKEKPDALEHGLKITALIISGLFAALLVGMEIERFISVWNIESRYYFKICQWLMIWSIATIGFCGGEWRSEKIALRVGSIISASIAFILLFPIYMTGFKTPLVFINFKFFASLLALAGFYTLSASLRDREWRNFMLAAINLLMLALLNLELYGWLGGQDKQYWPIISLNAAIVLSTIVYAKLFKKDSSISLAVSSLVIGIVSAFVLYAAFPQAYQHKLALNERFISTLAICIESFAIGYLLKRAKYSQAATFICWLFTAILLVLLSIESFLWFDNNIADPQKSQWISLLSVTIIWTLYAAAMLIFGFAANKRPVRLAALGLLAATAVKLLLLDMSNVQKGYRIASFMVLGVVMIAASYIYNRAEKFLLQAPAQTPANKNFE